MINQDEYTDKYMEYYPVVFGTVYSIIGNHEEAKDICQEIFIVFFQKYDEIIEKRKWLLGTVRNYVYKYYRKAGWQTQNIDDVFFDPGLTFVNGFRDTRILIKEAMDNIECDEQERTILDLIASFNFNYTHAGKALGLTRRQVTYKYKQIVNRITEYLNRNGINNIEDLL